MQACLLASATVSGTTTIKNKNTNTIAAMAKYSLTVSVTLALQVHGFVVGWPVHSMAASSIDANGRPLATYGKYAHV
jgi:hypothetical protein